MPRETDFSVIEASLTILENLTNSLERKLDCPLAHDDEGAQLRWVGLLAGLLSDEVAALRQHVDRKISDLEAMAPLRVDPKHLTKIDGGHS